MKMYDPNIEKSASTHPPSPEVFHLIIGILSISEAKLNELTISARMTKLTATNQKPL